MGTIIELHPELGNLVDETGALEDVELEAQLRTYRSRRRRQEARDRQARRARVEAFVVGGLLALAIAFAGSGAAHTFPQ